MIHHPFKTNKRLSLWVLMLLVWIVLVVASVCLLWFMDRATEGLPVYLYLLGTFATLSTLVYATYAIVNYSTLRYRITGRSIVVYAGLKKFEFPLEELHPIHQLKGILAFEAKAEESFSRWTYFPGSKKVMAFTFRGQRLILSPSHPTLFLATFYRVRKVRALPGENEQPLPAPVPVERRVLPVLWDMLQDNRMMGALLWDLLALLLFGGMVFMVVAALPSNAVLLYNLEQGTRQTGQREWLYLVWAGSIALFGLCFVLAVALYKREKIAALISLSAFPFLSMVLVVYLYSLFRYNG